VREVQHVRLVRTVYDCLVCVERCASDHLPIVNCRGDTAKSCQSLLDRVEQNDPLLIELVILPNKIFGASEVDRLAEIIGTQILELYRSSLELQYSRSVLSRMCIVFGWTQKWGLIHTYEASVRRGTQSLTSLCSS
jgi:hypothetical protein